MGWAATRRDLGGVIFVDLRDREGICQVVARPEVSEAAHACADHVRSEYVLAVVGEVAARSADTVNPNLDTGRIEVLAREIRILSEAKTPVFPIEDEIDTHEEMRLKYRYLDLRRPRLQRNLRLRHQATMEVRRLPRRAGLLRDRDADARQVDAGGRARLPRALARPPRQLLRAAAVAAAVQAAADDLGPRQVLPDRPLLPRRGPARRPPARVHPGRHRDVVPADGDDLRPRGAALPARHGDRGGQGGAPLPAPVVRGGASEATARTSPTCASTCRSPT